MSVPVARRLLLARKGRTLAGIAGIALALMLVLALKALLAGTERRLTGYIDRSGADIVVAQEGVRTMHMTQSVLPERVATAIAALPGVVQATPIVYVPTMLERGDKRWAFQSKTCHHRDLTRPAARGTDIATARARRAITEPTPGAGATRDR